MGEDSQEDEGHRFKLSIITEIEAKQKQGIRVLGLHCYPS